MVILLKHTLKNIFKKPFRSLILVFCMIVTAFTAYMTLDLSGAIGGIITNFTADMLGNTDVEVRGTHHIPEEIFEEFPANNALAVYGSGYRVATRDPEQYSYEFLKYFHILGLDLEKAYTMGVFSSPVELGAGETGISRTYAQDFGLVVGDTIQMYDEDGFLHDYIIKYILPEEGVFLQKGEYTAVVNTDEIRILTCREKLKSSEYLVDVLNDKEIDAFCDYMEEHYPAIHYERIKGNEQIQQSIAQITAIFVVLFVVTFLMVIFVTVGLSERIVCERMAVIGTFKSLGISDAATTFILLLENIFYGLVGALIGTALYSAIREVILNSMITIMEGETVKIDPMKGWIYAVVIGGAVLLQCACPIAELTKAVKTAIRDIIFSNKDTEAHISRKKTVAGFALLGISSVLLALFLNSNGFVVILSLILLVTALSLLMPLVMKGISGLLGRLFDKLSMPVASLAAREMGSKKSTVASGVLCVTVASLAISVYALSGALMNLYTAKPFEADVLALGLENKAEYYSFVKDLPGVTEVDFLYRNMDEPYFDGEAKKVIMDIMAIPEGDMFRGVELPEDLKNNEFVMTDIQAKEFGFSVGDTVEITFKTTNLFPIKKTMTFAGAVNTVEYETIPMIFLTQDTFIDIYHNNIGGFLIRCEDPVLVKEKVETYAMDHISELYTDEEYEQMLQSESQGMRAALYGIIALGIVLSLIGISGNQIIGFEGRKREYAVMHSTAMSKGQIRKLIFLETLITMGLGILISIFMGRIIIFLLEKAVFTIGLPLSFRTPFGEYVKMGLILLVVLLFTGKSPMKALRKMNTAQELKYE